MSAGSDLFAQSFCFIQKKREAQAMRASLRMNVSRCRIRGQAQRAVHFIQEGNKEPFVLHGRKDVHAMKWRLSKTLSGFI